MAIFQSSGWNNVNMCVCQPLDAATYDLDAATSSSRVANAAASILDAGACYVPNPKLHFSWVFLTPNPFYLTHNHKPSKYQGKMSKYSVKNKGLTWRIGHLSVHYKRFKDSEVIRWPLKGLRYIWKIMTRKYMIM